MLAEARAKGIAVSLEHVGLQELSYDRAFDAVMTIDAMENVSPEDWPLVLARLNRAVRPGSHLYLTVEEVDDVVVDAAHASLSAGGFPAVRGEIVEGDVAGYHYYPGRDRVLTWIAAEGLEVVTEEYQHARDAWGYRHFMLRVAGLTSSATAAPVLTPVPRPEGQGALLVRPAAPVRSVRDLVLETEGRQPFLDALDVQPLVAAEVAAVAPCSRSSCPRRGIR